MISARCSSLAMRPLDAPALAAGAAPGVADPAQAVAVERRIFLAETDWTNSHVTGHPAMMRPTLAERQCLACGVVAECYPGLPCATCGASSFHLIPRAPKL